MKTHALSFDVENWYDGNLYRGGFSGPADDRVRAETARVLDMLAEAGVRSTFFILGRVARRYPGLVSEVAAAGHEVACHSDDHEQVFRMTPAGLLDDLIRSRALLQDLSGQQVAGFRAPSWSIYGEALRWAPAVVSEAGFAYDSSVFPMRTPYYGERSAPLEPWYHELPNGRTLLELPPAVAGLGPLRVPYGGGIYWRIMPDWLIGHFVRRAPAPAVFYLHPWELNPEPVPAGGGIPRVKRPVLTVGIGRAERSLCRMLRAFRFGPLAEVFAEYLPGEVREWAGSTDSYAVTSSR